jgi:hypothetical protein
MTVQQQGSITAQSTLCLTSSTLSPVMLLLGFALCGLPNMWLRSSSNTCKGRQESTQGKQEQPFKLQPVTDTAMGWLPAAVGQGSFVSAALCCCRQRPGMLQQQHAPALSGSGSTRCCLCSPCSAHWASCGTQPAAQRAHHKTAVSPTQIAMVTPALDQHKHPKYL